MKKLGILVFVGICFLTACNGTTENNPDTETTGQSSDNDRNGGNNQIQKTTDTSMHDQVTNNNMSTDSHKSR
jgi:hypothetical protein